ncbi:hypothetical protein [Streptosporangium sp. NPDC002524]|uniref:hypothetical protein n=1 Tax=Streptosporangium sp. NPDC002524 TaxID=3154537 RepID=UPI00331E5A36
MQNADGRPSSLDDLLNASTPFATTSAEEIARRMTAAATRNARPGEATVDEQGDGREKSATAQADLGAEAGRRSSPGTAPGEQAPPFNPFELFEGMQELMTELQGFTTTLQGALDSVALFTGRDGSGTVEVTVGNGGRLENMAFLRSWRKTLTPETLEGAVLEAISNATLARFTSLVSGAGHPAAGPAAAPPPMPPVTPVPPADFDADQAIRVSGQLFAEFADSMRAVNAEGTPAEPAGTEVRSEKGRVTLTVANGAVTAVGIHRNWLKGADQSRVGEEIQTAFEAANPLIGTGSVAADALASSPGMRRLAEVTREFQELARHIGFSR